MGEDTRVLVSPGRTRRSSSYTEPGASLHSTLHSAHLPAHYRAGLSRGCCHLEDTAALRMIVVWMATVAVVVLVALIVEIVSQEHTVTVGDVVTDHPSCSDIGKEILKLGGNAVDAAVAASLCLAVAVPHRAGLGGGGVMLVHDVRRNHTAVLDFLEVRPSPLHGLRAGVPRQPGHQAVHGQPRHREARAQGRGGARLPRRPQASS